MEKTAFLARVSGRVQGVSFRAATRRRALALGLSGWVRNRRDGDVELYACGEPTACAELQQWLWQGPPAARVGSVDIQEAECAPVEDFIVAPDQF